MPNFSFCSYRGCGSNNNRRIWTGPHFRGALIKPDSAKTPYRLLPVKLAPKRFRLPRLLPNPMARQDLTWVRGFSIEGRSLHPSLLARLIRDIPRRLVAFCRGVCLETLGNTLATLGGHQMVERGATRLRLGHHYCHPATSRRARIQDFQIPPSQHFTRRISGVHTSEARLYPRRTRKQNYISV
jgi:hypothetical protein